ncbi:MAG: 3-deoxy-7-phosphoheptulonate synthase [Phenylobacterium sp.]|uniref:3-deoxy-7-phosphoheptulonate synthase n=1 Tax=Phenylobacterium sp. TaxID=1871053 RepID=UPI0027376C9B|nr:3-deoxy-7-phosphoheptulonate synthase [Phenylobacterium sp.]MDP3173142.1 3-deoxy-7-phosphoheptulonate synthase [Phenylobacterium sp.]
MPGATDDLRILDIKTLSPPEQVLAEFPVDARAGRTVADGRAAAQAILHGRDDRLLVVIGPCSIHDPAAALEYAERLAQVRQRLSGSLEIVMRVYFEKPRTTVGWKGLINDPRLDGSFQIDEGLRAARTLLLRVAELGLPAGCEFLDVITPQYITDLVSWGAIGARTTESQIHREMASGLSCPVGFKNGTSGDVQIAIDAVKAASQPHHFLAVTKDGRSAIASTAGNADAHVVLRGGRMPNYDTASVAVACAQMAAAGLAQRVMIDASHANSGKNPDNQPGVVDAVARQIEAGERRVFGLMVESNLLGGRQELVADAPLVYGRSITDGCIDWQTSVWVMERLANAVEARRARSGVKADVRG